MHLPSWVPSRNGGLSRIATPPRFHRRQSPTALAAGVTPSTGGPWLSRSAPPILTALILIGVGGTTTAQETAEDPVEALRRIVQQQQLEIDELRAAQEDLQAESEAGLSLEDYVGADDEQRRLEYGSEATVVSTHGFAHFQYSDPEGAHSTFDLTETYLFFGADLDESIQTWIEVEYEHGSEKIEIDQAELRFSFGNTTLAAGRFYNPFGIERRTWYPSVSDTESRPDAFRHVVPNNWYATGLRVDHDQALDDWTLKTEFAITNGLGELANTDLRAARQFRDNNQNKALSGRVGLTHSERLGFGISGATMEYARDDKINFLGVDLEYTPGSWILRTEAVTSSLQDSVGAVGNFRREGLYFLASREVFRREQESLRLAARFDMLDGNDGLIDEQDFSAFTLAASWYPRPHVTVRPEVRFFQGRHNATPASDYWFGIGVTLDF